MLMRLLRQQLERMLGWRGYELRQAGEAPRGFSSCLASAKSNGLAPRTVFDVGVGRGTPWLYRSFPDAKLVLFEPLPIFSRDLKALAVRYDADVFHFALSNTSGEADFNQNLVFPTSSSLLELDPHFADFAADVQARHSFRRQRVLTQTLDNVNDYDPPYVIKLDVEGAECLVLEGARRTLEQTDYVILEISVMRRLRREPSFAETVAFLDGCGFELYDIPSLAQAKGNGQLIYLDAAFVRKGSFLWPAHNQLSEPRTRPVAPLQESPQKIWASK